MSDCRSINQISSFNQPDPAKENKIMFQLDQLVDLTGQEHNCVAREGKAPCSHASREREQGREFYTDLDCKIPCWECSHSNHSSRVRHLHEIEEGKSNRARKYLDLPETENAAGHFSHSHLPIPPIIPCVVPNAELKLPAEI